MQVDRSHNAHSTLFPPTGGHSDTAKSTQTALPVVSAPVRGAQPVELLAATPPTPGVVLKLSEPTTRIAEKTLYSKGTSFAAQKIDLSNLTLENQLALGRNQGVFTKFTLSKDGVLLAQPDAAHSAQTPEFVACAVTAMRDYQEGINALSANGSEVGAKATGFFSSGLRSLQSAAAKFNVFA